MSAYFKGHQKFFIPLENEDFLTGRAGFTILELLIVIALIGLLASILLVSFEGAKERARIAQGWQFSDSLRAALQMEMVAWWPLDKIEPGSPPTTPDNWFDQNHGTIHGDPQVEKGVVNSALEFDGNDYVDCGSTLGNGFSAITIEAWGFPKALTGTDRGIIAKGHWNSDPPMSYRFMYQTDWGSGPGYPKGYWRFHVKNDGGAQCNVGGPNDWSSERENMWHHLAAVYDSANSIIKLFENGEEIGSSACSVGATANSGYMVGISGWDKWTGLLDEIRIYKAALPQTTIQQHYAQGVRRHQNLTKR